MFKMKEKPEIDFSRNKMLRKIIKSNIVYLQY